MTVRDMELLARLEGQSPQQQRAAEIEESRRLAAMRAAMSSQQREALDRLLERARNNRLNEHRVVRLGAVLVRWLERLGGAAPRPGGADNTRMVLGDLFDRARNNAAGRLPVFMQGAFLQAIEESAWDRAVRIYAAGRAVVWGARFLGAAGAGVAFAEGIADLTGEGTTPRLPSTQFRNFRAGLRPEFGGPVDASRIPEGLSVVDPGQFLDDRDLELIEPPVPVDQNRRRRLLDIAVRVAAGLDFAGLHPGDAAITAMVAQLAPAYGLLPVDGPRRLSIAASMTHQIQVDVMRLSSEFFPHVPPVMLTRVADVLSQSFQEELATMAAVPFVRGFGASVQKLGKKNFQVSLDGVACANFFLQSQAKSWANKLNTMLRFLVRKSTQVQVTGFGEAINAFVADGLNPANNFDPPLNPA